MARVGGFSEDLVRVCSSETFNQLVWVTFSSFPCFLAEKLLGGGKDGFGNAVVMLVICCSFGTWCSRLFVFISFR